MSYGGDLYDNEVDDDGADRIDNALTHFFIGALEAAAWLVGLAVVGALVGRGQVFRRNRSTYLAKLSLNAVSFR